MTKRYARIVVGGSMGNVMSNALSCKVIQTYGDAVARAEIEVGTQFPIYGAPTPGVDVDIWMDENVSPTLYVFHGFLDSFQPEPGKLKLFAKDELGRLANILMDHHYFSNLPSDPSYPDGKISAIFNDIVTTWGNMSTNSGATVQDSGTDIVQTDFDCHDANPFERMQKLAQDLGWAFYYRADLGFVYFEPKNYATNLNDLVVGTNVVMVPTWDYDMSEMINDLKIEGIAQLVSQSQPFVGDTSTVDFYLDHEPDTVAVYYQKDTNFTVTAPVEKNKLLGEVLGGNKQHDYYVDKKAKKITFTAFTPAAPETGDESFKNILVVYSYYAFTGEYRATNPTSISTYGLHAKKVSYTDLFSTADAENRATKILEKYAAPFKSTTLKCVWNPSNGYAPGQIVHVHDSISIPSVDDDFFIIKVTDNWPEATTEIEVGDKQYRIEELYSNLSERLARLEGKTSGSMQHFEKKTVNTEISFDLAWDSTTIDYNTPVTITVDLEVEFDLEPFTTTIEVRDAGGNLISTTTYTW